ncbi:MAG: FAD-binding protein [Caldilineaceae bacterium]|nr:FAD-binding protein [Caldilineaceae bacterium]
MSDTVMAPQKIGATPHKQRTADPGRALVDELQRRVQGEVRFDEYTRMLYSTDASLYQIMPVGVVIPSHADDVQATVEIAARHRTPILPRGSGSSLAGQAVGAAIVIDFSKYMDKVTAVDPDARTVTTQPGISVAVLNRCLGKHQLMLGPDPASADRASVGGSVGNNATGSHSILYGMMADNVVSASAVLADGSTACLGPLDPAALAAKARSETLEGRIYREIPSLIERIMPEIISRWPKHWRRASGYNLDRLAAALLPPDQRGQLSAVSRFRPPAVDPERIDHFNLAQLLTGSEGTLAVMTEVTLKLVEKPARTGLAVVHFNHVVEACAAITDVLETAPSASELMDKQMIDLARAQPDWARRLHFVEGDPAAVLITEYYGDTDKELIAQIERLEQHLRARGHRGAIVRVIEPQRVAEVWTVRKAGLNILMSRRGDHKPITGIEDVSVPPERLADYLGEILDFCMVQNDIAEVAVYAHASAGCLHVRPLLNMKSARDIHTLQVVGDFATDLCLKYGGAMSGEHGDGLVRSGFNPKLFGPTLYQALREVKGAFDPHNLMNPGKIVDAPPLSENLRMGPTYQTINLETVFDWRADHGFASAIEMCNGAGVCRKLAAGTMCPSYMATRDERDTTRARANALRNALAGRIPTEQLYSEEMYGVMDLCLGCKACKSECPSSVDMAKIKAEYLVHYYKRNGLPLFNRLMGMLPTLNSLLFRIAPQLAPLANWGLQTPLAKALFARIGVHPARDLPGYAAKSFEMWFRERRETKQPVSSRRAPVILFHDTWTNFNERDIGMAAVRVLEAAGYEVFLAAGKKCCGRPLITGGQADKARAWVDHNVALLAPYANQGIPIVGIEPSCILTLRDEYLSLASDGSRARLLAGHAYTFEEFVTREAQSGRFAPVWRKQPGKALLHGHCHHKALVGNEPSVAALKLAGYEVAVIPSGCCGMAGDFGYELGHYEISRAIGEDRLFPAVRAAAPETTIVASGTSCRHQIDHFTGRRPVHLVEALAAALG